MHFGTITDMQDEYCGKPGLNGNAWLRSVKYKREPSNSGDNWAKPKKTSQNHKKQKTPRKLWKTNENQRKTRQPWKTTESSRKLG